jgi:hypothetical protein
MYGNTAKWWRQHKDEFGAVPMTGGKRPRLGFDPAEVERILYSRRRHGSDK